MRYGSSGNLTATQPNKTGIETIEKLKKFGYDYIELPLSEIMDLPPEQREAIVTRVEASGIKSEVLNNLFPRRMKLTGPNIDRKAIFHTIVKLSLWRSDWAQNMWYSVAPLPSLSAGL